VRTHVTRSESQIEPRGRSPQAGPTGLLVLFAIIVSGCASTSPNPAPNLNASKTVRYEVTSDSGAASNVTYMINHGEHQDTKVTLPWSKEFTIDPGFQSLGVNARNAGPGSINCRILIDGKVVNQQTSNGQNAFVMCSGTS